MSSAVLSHANLVHLKFWKFEQLLVAFSQMKSRIQVFMTGRKLPEPGSWMKSPIVTETTELWRQLLAPSYSADKNTHPRDGGLAWVL